MTSSTPINVDLEEIPQNGDQRRVTILQPIIKQEPEYPNVCAKDEGIETESHRKRLEEITQMKLKEQEIERVLRLATTKRKEVFREKHGAQMRKLQQWNRNFIKSEKEAKVKAKALKVQRWKQFNASQTEKYKKV